MGPGFGKGQADFKTSLAELGELQAEQVEGSIVFRYGAAKGFPVSGPTAGREKVSDTMINDN